MKVSPTPDMSPDSNRGNIHTDHHQFSLIALVTIATACAEAAKLTHAQATAKLTAAGVKWTSSGGCSDRTKSTCTSFDQVNAETIAGVITLKKACACAITITGGTETGHAGGTYSHANGYKLDLSKNAQLNSYITGTFTRIADRGDGYAQYKAASGNIYCVSFGLFACLGIWLTAMTERGQPLGQHLLHRWKLSAVCL